MDEDLQHHTKYISKFIDEIKNKKIDVVVGVRDFAKRNQLSSVRHFGSKILILIIIFLGYKTLDPMSSYFLIKKKIFEEYESKMYGKVIKFFLI
jgi:hypothetical protein